MHRVFFFESDSGRLLAVSEKNGSSLIARRIWTSGDNGPPPLPTRDDCVDWGSMFMGDTVPGDSFYFLWYDDQFSLALDAVQNGRPLRRQEVIESLFSRSA